MKMVQSLISVIVLISTANACSNSDRTNSGSSTKSDPELRPMLGIESVTANNFVCLTKRVDQGGSKVYIGTGEDRIRACENSRQICDSITGFGDGTGACVTVVSYDSFITGIGQVQIMGGAGEGFACLAREMPTSGNGFSQRSWPGVGATIREAYANAISLCEFRGGASCNAWERCLDLSNASVMPPI